MPDTTTAPEPTDTIDTTTEPDDSTTTDTTETTEPDTASPPETGNAEAAKYRRRLREAESTVDSLTARLTALQRAEVLRLAGEHLIDAEDLFVHFGDDMANYVAEDGTADLAKIGLAMATLLDQRPYLGKASQRRVPAPNQAIGSSASGSHEPEMQSYADAFKASRTK